MLGEFLRLDSASGGETGRGQLGGLFGSRIVRRALDHLGEIRFRDQSKARQLATCIRNERCSRVIYF